MRLLWFLIGSYVPMLMTLGSCRETGREISYNQHIRPIFNEHCLACHGGVKQSGGFSLLFPEDAFADTESGHPAIIPGSPDKSELIRRLRHDDPELRMPFESPALAEAEIRLIEEWISEGANWEQHWAYLPLPGENEVPELNAGWGNNAIDYFIYKSLSALTLRPNPEASKEALLRRVSLDLIGLPPSLSELEDFVQDQSSSAYADQVDRLLASPHFGERWASMWLDLARYADSKGYEKDLFRSIWKYRDWVIRAFNQDMPFDQFTIEQLAGDLLPNPSQDQLIATAFHRNTMANDEGGTDNEEFRNYANIDRVSTTFEVWQGTTMACVQCHSHPYDPFRHEDFYTFLAFFNSTADRDIYHEGPNIFTYEGSERDDVASLIEWIQANIRPVDRTTLSGSLHDRKVELLDRLGYRRMEAEHFDKSSALIELTAPDQKTLFQIQDTSWIRFRNVDLSDVESITFRYASPFGGFIEARLQSQNGPKIGSVFLPALSSPKDGDRWKKWGERTMQIEATAGEHMLYLVFSKDQIADSDLFRLDWLHLNPSQSLLTKYDHQIQRRVSNLYDIVPTPTPIMQELPADRRRQTHIFERGNWLTPGKEVTPQVPKVLGTLKEPNPDRLSMAEWLVNQQNPLTARVIVNRFWEQIFGYGLVETLEDLGTQGIAPTHPELLDWLAVHFRDSLQWSVKGLLRTLVMSAAYRQSSYVDEAKLERDPRNQFLSRGPRIRLSAEQMRDQILAVSDLLNPALLGPSVRPPYPSGSAQFRFGDRYDVSARPDQFRRSIYTYIKRTNPFPHRINFDGTDRTFCTSRRIRTNTPLQALALLNDPVYLEAAENLAAYMMTVDASVEERIRKGYQKVMLRDIDLEKQKALVTLYEEGLMHADGDVQLALTLTANALFNLDEFVQK